MADSRRSIQKAMVAPIVISLLLEPSPLFLAYIMARP
jgi:hypothetical protein